MWIIATHWAVMLHKSVHGFKIMQKHVYRRTSNVGVGRSNSVDPRVRHRYARVGAALAAALLVPLGQGKGTTAGVAPAHFGDLPKRTGKILLQAVEMSKIILEILIDICYTDSVPLYIWHRQNTSCPTGQCVCGQICKEGEQLENYTKYKLRQSKS